MDWLSLLETTGAAAENILSDDSEEGGLFVTVFVIDSDSESHLFCFFFVLDLDCTDSESHLGSIPLSNVLPAQEAVVPGLSGPDFTSLIRAIRSSNCTRSTLDTSSSVDMGPASLSLGHRMIEVSAGLRGMDLEAGLMVGCSELHVRLVVKWSLIWGLLEQGLTSVSIDVSASLFLVGKHSSLVDTDTV